MLGQQRYIILAAASYSIVCYSYFGAADFYFPFNSCIAMTFCINTDN